MSCRHWWLAPLSCLALTACVDAASPDDDVETPLGSPTRPNPRDAKVRVTPTSGLGTTEAGGTAEFTVELTEAPTAEVTILAHVSDDSEGRLEQTRLVFTPDDFGPRTVRVAGVDDVTQDGNQPFEVILDEAVSTDIRFQSVPVADVAVTNVDDDTVGVTILAADDMTLAEGGTATFTVRLNTRPTAEVVVRLASSDPVEAALSTQELRFYAREWDVAQTVTITGPGEDIDDGDKAITVTTARVQTTDIEYAGLDPADVRLTKVDDDTAGVVVPDIVVYEGWYSESVEIRLSSRPTAVVVVALSGDDGQLYSQPVYFYPHSWQYPRSLRAEYRGDDYADGTRVIAAQVVTTTVDPAYAALRQTVPVTVYDSRTAGVTVSIDGTTSERGGCTTAWVGLHSRPRGDVVVRVASRDRTEITVDAEIRISDDEWRSIQVPFCGVDDDLLDGDQAAAFVVEVVSSTDPVYAALPAAEYTIINRDDENLPVLRTIEPVPYTTSEGGSVDVFVRLPGQPSAPVILYVRSSWLGLPSVQSLTFTPDNWNLEQTVTVTGDRYWGSDVQSYQLVVGVDSSDDPRFLGAFTELTFEHRPN